MLQPALDIEAKGKILWGTVRKRLFYIPTILPPALEASQRLALRGRLMGSHLIFHILQSHELARYYFTLPYYRL